MTKLGWSILALIVLVVAGFVSMLSFGGGARLVSPAPTPAPTSVARTAGALVVPVAGFPRSALQPNWGDPRGGGTRRHEGLDIMAAQGTPVVAAATGRVEKLFDSELGGTTLYQRSADGRWTYYYAHLAGYAPGLREGGVLRAGQTLGYVGDTGDAGAGNYHLHFGVSRMAPGERWWQGEPVDPFPLLAGRDASR